MPKSVAVHRITNDSIGVHLGEELKWSGIELFLAGPATQVANITAWVSHVLSLLITAIDHDRCLCLLAITYLLFMSHACNFHGTP